MAARSYYKTIWLNKDETALRAAGYTPKTHAGAIVCESCKCLTMALNRLENLVTNKMWDVCACCYESLRESERERGIVPDNSKRRETFAAAAHDSWCGWMRYLFSSSHAATNGETIIPAELVKRWARQMNTSYAALSEDEKESDRIEADRYLRLLEDTDADK